MKIAIIGMGNVGRSLGPRWVESGHLVTFCVRNPDDSEKRAFAEAARAGIGPVDAAQHSDVILLAVPWHDVADVLEAAGDLSGKILLDCTNPVNADFTELTLGHDTSAAEEILRMVPRAHVVKIFNTNGAKNMADSDYGNHKVTMLYAGDDTHANETAARLAEQIGFEPIELGPLCYARLLEPLAMTWIMLARHRGFGHDFALDVVRRTAK